MAVILTPDKWRRQPSGPLSLNWGDSLTNGLVYAGDLGGPGVRDLVSGKIDYSAFGTAPSLAPSVGPVTGPVQGMSQASSAGGRIFYGPGAALSPQISTHLVMFRFAGLSGGYGGLLSCGSSDAAQNYWALQDGGGNNNLSIWPNNSGGDSLDSVTNLADGKMHAWCFSRASAAANTVVYKDGAYFSTVTSGASTSSPPANGRIVYFGERAANTGYGAYGSIALHLVWRRALSASEQAEVTASTWQLFRKQPRILYFTAPSGGGATIAGDSGTYTLTGSDVSLKAGRKLAADSGSYSLSGTDAAFKRGYALVASSGTYTVYGTAVSLKAGRKLAADSGSYTLTGTDATLTYAPAGSYNLTAESGSYSLTGTAATLRVSRKLSADSGAYSLTGTTATLAKGVRMAAASGSYTLTGSNVSFARTYVLTAESGSYTLTGTSAGLTWSGAPVVVDDEPIKRIYPAGGARIDREIKELLAKQAEQRLSARLAREDEEIICIMALMAA